MDQLNIGGAVLPDFGLAGFEADSTSRPTNIASSILELMGCGKPLMFYLGKTVEGCPGKVVIFAEPNEPCRGKQDMVGLEMIQDAEKKNKITKGRTTLVEATSQDTAVGLAYIASIKGYHIDIFIPEPVSAERCNVLKGMGATVHVTDSAKGMKGAHIAAKEMVAGRPDSYLLNRYEDKNNPRVHYETTGPQIWAGAEGTIDTVVFGVNTGGTMSGAGDFLREKNLGIKIVMVEPAESAVASGDKPRPHQIQGLGAFRIPAFLQFSKISEIVLVSAEEASSFARRLATEEGLMVGIDSGAVAFAAAQIAKRPENAGMTVVAVLPSFGLRHMATLLPLPVTEATSSSAVDLSPATS